MLFGVNLLLLGDSVDRRVMRWFPRLKEMGFDGVEVPVFNPDAVPADEIRAQAAKAGLLLTASGALPPGTRFYGKAAAPRRAAEKYIRGCIKAVAALGAPVVCGPLYKAVGDVDQSLPLEQQRRETAKALKQLMPLAEEADVTLAFEPLNRFETNFMNTVAQGIAFCRATGSRKAGLLLDTFHMHIEEKDSAAAFRAAAAAGVLAHVHLSENDRGIAGTGQVHWREVGAAIKASRYSRWCVLESFNQENQAIKTAVSCWRPFFPSEKRFAAEGLAFVRKLLSDAH
ncbi:sugar phosphate isomerase/epimerase [bacterium]|nr:sugar phosphate isomerase/epimerase [bacterium]